MGHPYCAIPRRTAQVLTLAAGPAQITAAQPLFFRI